MDVPWTGALREATLLGVSAQTTTGFSHLDVSSLSPLVLVVVIVSMLIGGSVGSSAGGIKLFRVIVVWHMLRTALRRTAMPPHAVTDARAGGRKLEPEDLERVLLMVMLFVVTVALSWMAFLADGHAPLPALFEVSSAVGTVGLSAGVTSHELEWPLKLILCADMWLGRLEILAILVLLYPPTWLSRRAEI